jgi:hypothetical protein
VYIGYFRGSKDILVIIGFERYFGHFWGFGVILVILDVFRRILVILDIPKIFWSL